MNQPKRPPLKLIGVTEDKKPPLNLITDLGDIEKKNLVGNDLPTGTQTSKRGFEPFLPQVPTKAPSVLTPEGQVGYQEQVKDFKPIVQKEQALPKQKPLSNLESIKNTVYNVANSLKGVLPRLSLTSVDVFEKVIGKDLTGRLASLPRIEFSTDGVDIVTGRTPEQIRNESIQSLDYLNTQVAPTAGIVENARNFNIPGLAAGVIDAAGGLVSTIIPSALSGGSLLVTEMVGGGLYDYNTAKAKSKGVSTEELYKRGDADFGVPAAIGGVAYSMERIGLKGFTNAISKKLAGSGFKKSLLLGTEWNKEGLTEWVQVGLDEANVALANGLSVEDAAIAAANKMTSVQGLEAYAKGFAGSAAASSTARGLKKLVSPKNKTKVSELEQQKNQSFQDLANENIPIEAKNAILDVLENTNEQIDDLVNIDRKEIEQLSESQAVRVSEINAKIEDIDLAINDVNISESTKSILEKQKQELDSELDGIIATPEIKLAKPTFDTEEQIIAEGQQAEADFQATDDLVTYEQKMKELDDRAKNLVPAPEDAEIGKPEEVVEVEPIRQLGTGANVYFETEKYRVNDGLKNGKFLLNIGGKDGDVPVANIEFDNASDAVKIAERISKDYPQGVPDALLIDKYVEGLKKDLLVTKPQIDAVQVETAGQVPVLTEAPVGEEVEQGKPKPKNDGGNSVGGDKNTPTQLNVNVDKIRKGTTNSIEFLKPIIGKNGAKLLSYTWESKDFGKDKFGKPIRFSDWEKAGVNADTGRNIVHKFKVEVDGKVLEVSADSVAKALGFTDAEMEKVFPKAKDFVKQLAKMKMREQALVNELEDTNEAVANAVKKVSDEYGVKIDVYKEGDNVIASSIGMPKDDVMIGDESAHSIVRGELRKNGVLFNERQKVGIELNRVGNLIKNKIKQSLQFGDLKFSENKAVEQSPKEPKAEEQSRTQEAELKPKESRKVEELTSAQEVEQLRAEEQVELNAAIPNADQYLTDDKVDKAKLTDPNDIKAFDEIYDKYDKLITPLLPEKETKAEQTPAKSKASKLKSKVDTRLKFQEVSDLSTKINEAVKGSAKRKRLIGDRNLLLEKFPVIKYVYDNIQNITKQLVQKGVITKDGDKVTYDNKKYSVDEFSSLLHDGLLDQLVNDNVIDDSNFVQPVKPIEKTEDDISREQTQETEILLNGLADKRRKDGKFIRDGVEYVRNEKGLGELSDKKGEVRFTNEISIPFRYKLVEANTLQPSHQDGIRNSFHFIPEAQPKNRNDKGSLQAEESFANNPRFNELGESTNAYSGAPVVNERNEVIQGNNRSAGLRKGYSRGNEEYKNSLIKNAAKFGFTEEQVSSMESPILVRQVAVSDEGAIEIGNYDVKDLETGGIRRLDPVAITRRMPFSVKGRMAELMFSGDETLNQTIRDNQKKIIEIISPYINQAQRNTIIKDGVLSDVGIKDIEDIAKQFLFDNGNSLLPQIFENLSATQKEGLKRSLPYIFSVPPEKGLVQDIQVAIVAINDFNSSEAGSFDGWLAQADMFNEGLTPKDKYSPLEIAIAKLVVEEKTQKGISSVFSEYARVVTDKPADMFEPAKEGKSRAEGVLEIFKVEDNERPSNTTSGEDVDSEQKDKAKEKAEPSERKTISIRTPAAVQKKEPEVKIKALSEIDAFKAKVKEAKANLDKLKKNLGIASDPEQKAKALFEYHKALVGLAKAYIKAGVNSIKDFAREIGENITQEVKDAWNEANGRDKKTLADFKAEIDTSLINEEVKLKRDIYGFDEPLLRETKPNPELLEEAIQNIKDGESVYDIIAKAKNGEPLTDIESVMLSQFQGTKEAELYKINKKIEQSKDSSPLEFDKAIQKRAEIIDDLIASYDASELSGTVTGRALQARKVRVLQDYSLANMFIRVRKANNNRNLTNEQINEITDRYNELIEAEAKLKAKVEQLTKDNENLKLAKSEARLRRDAVKDSRNKNRAEVQEALKSERVSIIEQMKKILNKSRGTLSMNPMPVEMFPLVGKLAKNYFVSGITSIEEIVDKVYDDVKDLVENVSKRDIRDAISGYGRDVRPTQDDLQRELYDLREQAKLISRIEDAELGVKKAKDEKVKRVASDEAKKLRARLRDLTKEEASLEAIKKSLKRRIAETKNKIDKKDYSKPEKIEVELDDEAKKLQNAYRKIKFEFDVAVEKDKLANRTQSEVWQDRALEVFNLPRALMATADLSAPLRQGLLPTLSNPVMAFKAFVEMLKQWNSKDVADTWLADLKDSPGYQLMEQSGLYIADRTNAKVTAKEEDFQSNLAEKIPLVAKSERAYVGYLNKMRADLFSKGVNVLQNDGISFASNPKAYKALATYINASTGRGNLGMLEKAAPLLNAAFFSPRLMASRVQLLTNWANPSFYKNTPAAVRKMYFKDMGTFIAFGMGILALAALSGADTEEDPRSPDFGKIRSGNTRWDIWGGFQQFVRYTVQVALGEKKSTASDKITPLDGSSYSKETRMSVIGNFIRSKLAPVPSAVVDYLYGENMIGDPFNLSNAIISRVFPLVWQGVYESAKQDGWAKALLITGVPSILGIGVQTYGLNDFLEQGVDDKSIKLLIDKKAVAIEPKETERTVIDAVTGEKRKMDDDEFEKYYASWADYIKNDLKENYSEYQKMSNEKFETEFRKIKSNATSYAKEQVTNVIPETLTLEIDNVTYKLTPNKVAKRKEYIQEYIDKNKNKRSFKIKIENLIEKGSIKDTPTEIKKILMSDAKEYATEKMKKEYKNNLDELGVIED